VALLAAVAKLAVMHILAAVARNAGRANFCGIHVLGCGLPMATLAGDFAVRALQPVGGPAVVVKVPDGPGTGVVTGFAAHSKLLFVFVFILVARNAILLCIFVTTCLMAVFAGRCDVAPGERKAGLCMIELRGLPRLVAVALFALGTQLVLVFVILLMAADAIHHRIAITAQVFVTGVTFDF
jgi:hypothetical protein